MECCVAVATGCRASLIRSQILLFMAKISVCPKLSVVRLKLDETMSVVDAIRWDRKWASDMRSTNNKHNVR